jgi:hypothetical protein
MDHLDPGPHSKLSHGLGLKGLDLDILELGTPSRPAGECPGQDYQLHDKADDKCTKHEWDFIAGRLFVFFNHVVVPYGTS